MTAKFRSTKTFGHDLGLSACFRQWRATHSHCSKLHGYAISVHLEFESETLDSRNWVLDFGSLKPVKKWLETMFDHKTLVAYDDPDIEEFRRMFNHGVIDVQFVEAVGCEAFSKLIFEFVAHWLGVEKQTGRCGPDVRLMKVEVREHGANSAIYMED